MKHTKITKLLTFTLILLTTLLLVSCIDYKEAGNQDTTEPIVEEPVTEEVVDSELTDLDTNPVDETTTEEPIIEEPVAEPEPVPEPTPATNEAVNAESEKTFTIEVNEGELIDLNAEITDPDNDEVSFQYSQPIDNNGQWQTKYGDAGEYIITLTATDKVNTVTQDINIKVKRVNLAPELEDIPDMFFMEGDTIVLEPTATDPNGDSIEIKISGILSEGILETDYTSAGVYEIRVSATDGELSTQKSFTLTIDNVNILPTISGISDFSIKEGETVTIEPVVEDIDGDRVTVTISDPVGSDGTWLTSYTDNGEYIITVTANDGQDIVTEKITVTITDVNMPPEIVDVTLERN